MNLMVLFSSFSSNKSLNQQSSVSFSLRPAPWDSSKTLVHPSGYPTAAPPMCSITCNDSAPNVVLFRGWGKSPWDIIGDARLPSLSSKIHLGFYGQPIYMRLNQLSRQLHARVTGHRSIKMETRYVNWEANWEEHGVAGCYWSKAGKSGGKVLEVLVFYDSRFFEFVLLSEWTARTINKLVTEATGEILGAGVGA
ncbi:hypothetical protein N7463_004749 [Penicillium fimorum]|uniref:Uncharacterized protein n=1 Tax=Penicillium fimorum TaxID=1882269 RepID=A0A9X0C500_9EURO|nr:hypothetical protein N7463_004749 [Penicillium fimorum]